MYVGTYVCDLCGARAETTDPRALRRLDVQAVPVTVGSWGAANGHVCRACRRATPAERRRRLARAR